MDPITLELYRHRFGGAAEEMGVTFAVQAIRPTSKSVWTFPVQSLTAPARWWPRLPTSRPTWAPCQPAL